MNLDDEAMQSQSLDEKSSSWLNKQIEEDKAKRQLENPEDETLKASKNAQDSKPNWIKRVWNFVTRK